MNVPVKPARCGTNSGYTRHQKDGETPCDACARAKSEYDQRRREAGENTQRNRMYANAQRKALQQLRRRYTDEYEELYASWKARLFEEAGLTPKFDRIKVSPPSLGRPQTRGGKQR